MTAQAWKQSVEPDVLETGSPGWPKGRVALVALVLGLAVGVLGTYTWRSQEVREADATVAMLEDDLAAAERDTAALRGDLVAIQDGFELREKLVFGRDDVRASVGDLQVLGAVAMTADGRFGAVLRVVNATDHAVTGNLLLGVLGPDARSDARSDAWAELWCPVGTLPAESAKILDCAPSREPFRAGWVRTRVVAGGDTPPG